MTRSTGKQEAWAVRHAENIRAIRGLFLVLLGTIILVNEFVFLSAPRPIAVGAGLALCGLEAALRLDKLVGVGGGK